MAVTCDHCGRSDPGDQPPLTWSLSVEDGHARRFCEECTRTHVRAMEAKLHPHHW